MAALEAVDGYSALLACLQRAKEIEAVGEVFGAELVRRWQQAEAWVESGLLT